MPTPTPPVWFITGCSLRQTASQIGDYADTAGARLKGTVLASGSQPGDPVKAVEAMMMVTEAADPPRHLVLGAFGLETVTNKLKATLTEIEVWRNTGVSADFPRD